ncbi:MAG: hypothetical protein M3N33_00395 [Actinomycetota bacterium]|nr:hypothetical protein [Actinomycetota bacterium]
MGRALEQIEPPELFPFDAEALVQRGGLVHRSLVAGRELDEPAEDRSE